MVAELKIWLTENFEALHSAAQDNRLFAEISPLVLRFATSRAIQAISSQDLVPRALREWVAGKSYAMIVARHRRWDRATSLVNVDDVFGDCRIAAA